MNKVLCGNELEGTQLELDYNHKFKSHEVDTLCASVILFWQSTMRPLVCIQLPAFLGSVMGTIVCKNKTIFSPL